jgi:AcrR family transcriptional regulator
MAGDSLRKADYFEAAIELLASGGIGAVTISALCYRLEVTKGSFYHHFASGKSFHQELLRYWEHDRVEQLMPFLEAMDPVERLNALKLGAVSMNQEAASAFRAWARTDKRAASSQARIDRETEKLLARFLVEAGVPQRRAPVLARIGYSILIATQQLERPVDRERLLESFDEYQRWLESTIEARRSAPVVSVVGRRSSKK